MTTTTDRVKSAAGFDTIEFAIGEIAAGHAVIVVDDEDRENEGDLIFAAELATPELVAFTVRHSSGLLCVPLSGEDCDRLGLPPMYHVNQDRKGTAYTVSVDAKDGVTTGISATDRAWTMRVLADPATTLDDLTRPGHVLPLRAREGGVLVRPGHTEASVDLAKLAGLRPAAGICEIVSSSNVGEMARLPELQEFAAEHDLALISIADLVAYRRATGSPGHQGRRCEIATAAGQFPRGRIHEQGHRPRVDRSGSRRHR